MSSLDDIKEAGRRALESSKISREAAEESKIQTEILAAKIEKLEQEGASAMAELAEIKIVTDQHQARQDDRLDELEK